MPLTISTQDLKLQVVLNLQLARHSEGATKAAATRLADLWASQLSDADREEIRRNEQIIGL